MILQNDNGNTRLLATKASKWALYNTKTASLMAACTADDKQWPGVLKKDKV